jgi:hypothetical protein
MPFCFTCSKILLNCLTFLMHFKNDFVVQFLSEYS